LKQKKKAKKLRKEARQKKKELEAAFEESKDFDSAANELTFTCPSLGLQVTDDSGDIERTILEVNVKDINLQLG